MINKLKVLLKKNPYLYDIYYYVFSYMFKFIGILVPKKRRILFVSFGGKKFDDSPKAIYEEIMTDPDFKDYELCWAFDDIDQFVIPKGRKICINSIGYILYALSAEIWITNSSIGKGLNFKNKHTYYINTWHGIPLKRIGKDELSKNMKHGLSSKKGATCNLVTAQSTYDQTIFSRLFEVSTDNIILSGLPRNDILINYQKEDIETCKTKIGIPKGKKIILYAPTYREFKVTLKEGVVQETPFYIEILKEELSDEYVILFRAHYEVAKVLDVTFDDFIIDVSEYPTLSDLMLCSDILITDYSSMLFDFSILERPIILYCYDLEEYVSKRGLYFDVRELNLPIIRYQKDLYEAIRSADNSSVTELREKFCMDDGTASKQVVAKMRKAIREVR